jgi:hypothetical protein
MRTTGSTARVRVTPLNSLQLNQRLQVRLRRLRRAFLLYFKSLLLQLRRLKIDGLYPSAPSASDSAADFYSVPDTRVTFVPAASGRSGTGKSRPPSLVQALMAGGGGGTLPSGVVALGQEKRAIESLLQQVCCARIFFCFYCAAAWWRAMLQLTSRRDTSPQLCKVPPHLFDLGLL